MSNFQNNFQQFMKGTSQGGSSRSGFKSNFNQFISSDTPLTKPTEKKQPEKKKATPQQTEQLFSRYGIKKPVEKKTDYSNIAKLPDFSKSIISKVKIDSSPRKDERIPDPNQDKIKEKLKKALNPKKEKEPFKIKDIPTKIIDSFKEDLERRAGNFKEGIDFYSDMFTGVIKESSSGRPEVGRVGGTLKDIRESKYSLQNPAPAYEPKTAGEKAGSLVWKLTEDINVFKLNQLETPFDVGIKSITSTPKYQYIQAKIKESVVKAGKSVVDNLTKLNQKIRPLKITFEDISAVTKGTGTPQQRIKFDKFQELRATGMPIEEILAAGKDSKPTTKIADFLDDVIAKIKKSFGKELSKEEQKLLTSGAKDASIVIDSGTYESQEILDKVLTTPLQETKEGKTLIKEAIEAKGTGQVITIKPKTPSKPITTPSKTLEQEATKYKSAEEFINAQPVKTSTLEGSMGHRPSFEDMPPAYNLLEGDMLPRDVYTQPDFSIASGRIRSGDKAANESWSALQKIKNKPDADVTIYRASPKKELRNGDWVSFSKEYAKGEGLHPTDSKLDTPVFSYKVKARDVIFAGDDINEFGYWGHSTKEIQQLTDIYNKATKKAPTKTKPKKPTKKTPKVKTKAKLVPRGQVPVGEGKVKVSALEARIKHALGSLSEEQIKEMGLAKYNEMNKKENIAKASKYVSENPEEAMKVLTGQIDAPKGVLRNSVLIAMQNLSPKDMDVKMANRLGTLFSSRGGQESSILTEVNKNLPVNILSDIIQIRTQAVEKRFGKTIDKITKAKVKKGETMIKAPTNWDSFLREVRC